MTKMACMEEVGRGIKKIKDEHRRKAFAKTIDKKFGGILTDVSTRRVSTDVKIDPGERFAST